MVTFLIVSRPPSRERDDEVSEGCKEELFRVELEAAADYRTDAEMNKYCQADANKYCPDVEPGDGRVQDCLVRGGTVSALCCAGECFLHGMVALCKAGIGACSLHGTIACRGKRALPCLFQQPVSAP